MLWRVSVRREEKVMVHIREVGGCRRHVGERGEVKWQRMGGREAVA